MSAVKTRETGSATTDSSISGGTLYGSRNDTHTCFMYVFIYLLLLLLLLSSSRSLGCTKEKERKKISRLFGNSLVKTLEFLFPTTGLYYDSSIS